MLQAWANGPAIEAHRGEQKEPGGLRGVAARVRGCARRCRVRREGLAGYWRRSAAPSWSSAPSGVHIVIDSSASAGDAGARISINTPQGVRAKQIVDMLNLTGRSARSGSRRSPRPTRSTTSARSWTTCGGNAPTGLPGRHPGRRRPCTCRRPTARARDIELHTGDDTWSTGVRRHHRAAGDPPGPTSTPPWRTRPPVPRSRSTVAATVRRIEHRRLHCHWRPSSSSTSPRRGGGRQGRHRVLGRPADHHRRGQDRRLVGIRQDARRHPDLSPHGPPAR